MWLFLWRMGRVVAVINDNCTLFDILITAVHDELIVSMEPMLSEHCTTCTLCICLNIQIQWSSLSYADSVGHFTSFSLLRNRRCSIAVAGPAFGIVISLVHLAAAAATSSLPLQYVATRCRCTITLCLCLSNRPMCVCVSVYVRGVARRCAHIRAIASGREIKLNTHAVFQGQVDVVLFGNRRIFGRRLVVVCKNCMVHAFDYQHTACIHAKMNKMCTTLRLEEWTR